MQLVRKVLQLSVAFAATAIVGCTSSLPDLPRVLEPEVTAPVQPETAPAPVSSGVQELEIRVLHKANYNPFDRDNGKSFRALNNVENYRSELGRHSIETAKPVDFNNSQVLVSSVGEKPTGGYSVSAAKMEEYPDNIVITVIQTVPGPSCITTQGKTYPFEFVVVPSLKPIEIFERQKIEEC